MAPSHDSFIVAKMEENIRPVFARVVHPVHEIILDTGAILCNRLLNKRTMSRNISDFLNNNSLLHAYASATTLFLGVASSTTGCWLGCMPYRLSAHCRIWLIISV